MHGDTLPPVEIPTSDEWTWKVNQTIKNKFRGMLNRCFKNWIKMYYDLIFF